MPDLLRRSPYVITAAIDDPALLGVLAELAVARVDEMDADIEENTRLPANPLASPDGIDGIDGIDDIKDLDGWTLHRLRHSALTYDAEDGTSTPMLARSRHASVRSLARYAMSRRRLGRPARRRTRPRCTPPHVNPSSSGLQDHPVAPFGAYLGHTPVCGPGPGGSGARSAVSRARGAESGV
ncbi:hypothetical protein [Streptomyces sp. NBC_00690]|uniref:hypothetical protein n=1 Tax=Streptomyces sp. NBC_00690 TaxID=2975808 RepID=UPI002E2AFEF7|nr:hypothetical protein [Streptomyces sp. NBC_00690]